MTMQLKEVLAALDSRGSKAGIASHSRFGITVSKAYGVAMKDVQAIAKKAGRDHVLAQKLWASGWYEARLAAAYIGDPVVLTKKEMNAWAADFDNWGVCDTLCFVLFDRSPHAYNRAAQWAKSPKEFVKRAGFALMASVAGHDKAASPAKFLAFLQAIGGRRNGLRPLGREGRAARVREGQGARQMTARQGLRDGIIAGCSNQGKQ